jgi:hypothetical protein
VKVSSSYAQPATTVNRRARYVRFVRHRLA